MKRLFLLPLYGLVLLATLFVLLLGSNLHTWHRLTHESPIAELTFRQAGEHEFEATIAYGDFCTAATYRLHGEQWRLDARFLKWRSWANLLGLDSLYRIERLGGRYLDVADENTAEGEAFSLQSAKMPDLTEIMGRYKGGLSPVDTLYGSSVYAAMDEQHVYRVYRGQSGLLVRRAPRVGINGPGRAITIPINTACKK